MSFEVHRVKSVKQQLANFTAMFVAGCFFDIEIMRDVSAENIQNIRESGEIKMDEFEKIIDQSIDNFYADFSEGFATSMKESLCNHIEKSFDLKRAGA